MRWGQPANEYEETFFPPSFREARRGTRECLYVFPGRGLESIVNVEFFLLRARRQTQAVFPSPLLIDCLSPLWWGERTAFCATRGCISDVLFHQLIFGCLLGVALVCNEVQPFFHLHYAIFDIHVDVSLDNSSNLQFQ